MEERVTIYCPGRWPARRRFAVAWPPVSSSSGGGLAALAGAVSAGSGGGAVAAAAIHSLRRPGRSCSRRTPAASCLAAGVLGAGRVGGPEFARVSRGGARGVRPQVSQAVPPGRQGRCQAASFGATCLAGRSLCCCRPRRLARRLRYQGRPRHEDDSPAAAGGHGAEALTVKWCRSAGGQYRRGQPARSSSGHGESRSGRLQAASGPVRRIFR